MTISAVDKIVWGFFINNFYVCSIFFFFGKSQYYHLENILNPKYLFVRVGIGYGSNWTWKWNPLGKHITYSLKVKYNSFKHMYVGTFVYTYNKYFLNITCIRKYCIYVGMCVCICEIIFTQSNQTFGIKK